MQLRVVYLERRILLHSGRLRANLPSLYHLVSLAHCVLPIQMARPGTQGLPGFHEYVSYVLHWMILDLVHLTVLY